MCVADRRWHTMHDYMKALYHRFEAPSRRAENLDRKIKRTHNQLTRLLDKPGRKLLLRIADMEDELRDEACLNSFISGYRLHRAFSRSCWQTSRHTASRQKMNGRLVKVGKGEIRNNGKKTRQRRRQYS